MRKFQLDPLNGLGGDVGNSCITLCIFLKFDLRDLEKVKVKTRKICYVDFIDAPTHKIL
jgi:hypothetical protein